MKSALLVALWATLAVGAAAQTLTAPIGVCEFSPAQFAFRGDAREQARCLLHPIRQWAVLDGEDLVILPPALDRVVGAPFDFERSATLRALEAGGLPPYLVAGIRRPVSYGGPEQSLRARYFVIHDTSTPDLGTRPFASDLDTDEETNSFHYYRTRITSAHVFVNRRGEIYVAEDFSSPLRATKLERFEYGGRLTRGMFLHVELVQPRRHDPSGSAENHGAAPEVGFSAAQYRRAAQLYVLASARAGEWLIPAFHANIDRLIPEAHDDPQNFSLPAFDAALADIIAEVQAESAAPRNTTASPAPSARTP